MSDLYDGNGNVIAVSGGGESNPWAGKNWIAFGTSITDVGAGTGKYIPYLITLSGMICTEEGRGGAWITNNGGIYTTINNFIKSTSNYDLVTIEGFVNDWYKAQPLGVPGDKTIDTFCGALYLAIQHIMTNTNARIVVITDTHTRKTDKYPNWGEFCKNSAQVTQMEFWKATKEVCNALGVPVIEAGANSGISPLDEIHYVDQVHHSELGGEVFARQIWAELKNIPPMPSTT